MNVKQTHPLIRVILEKLRQVQKVCLTSKISDSKAAAPRSADREPQHPNQQHSLWRKQSRKYLTMVQQSNPDNTSNQAK
ncbi:hypothetical protein Hanom_Chr08g00686341 [Helianthus anomalus]